MVVGESGTKRGCCVLQGVRLGGVVGPGGFGEGHESRGLICPVCGKEFNSRNRRQDLQRHLLSHTGERPFACPFCPYRATLKGNLKKHIQGLHAQLLKAVEESRASPPMSPPSFVSSLPYNFVLDDTN